MEYYYNLKEVNEWEELQESELKIIGQINKMNDLELSTLVICNKTCSR